MAVYTDVSIDELETFLAAYELGRPNVFKGIAEGVSNSNYYLECEGGRFILTLYEKRIETDDIPFFLELMTHLASRGVSCPTPVAQRSGALFGTLNKRPAAVLTFLDGVSLRRPSAENCAAVGTALAALHETGSSFAKGRPNTLGLRGWQGLAVDCDAHADKVADGLKALIDTELEYLAHSWPSDLPRGIIHADLFPDNVLFLGDGVSGLIDFYFACTDALAYDLAVMLNAWCFESDGAFNVTKARALLAAYQKARPLSAEERAALPLLARGAALRFTLTRLYDWVNRSPDALVRPKDPREFARRLRFHRNVKGPEAYGL